MAKTRGTTLEETEEEKDRDGTFGMTGEATNKTVRSARPLLATSVSNPMIYLFGSAQWTKVVSTASVVGNRLRIRPQLK